VGFGEDVRCIEPGVWYLVGCLWLCGRSRAVLDYDLADRAAGAVTGYVANCRVN
jgi:hypothetical protein